eukprot:13488866-Ditylum_brightwellii.AAC.1
MDDSTTLSLSECSISRGGRKQQKVSAPVPSTKSSAPYPTTKACTQSRGCFGSGECSYPHKMGEMELELHTLQIEEGMFVKNMKPVAKDGEDEEAKET